MNPEVTRPMFAEQPWFQQILRDWGFRPTAATTFTNGRASLRLDGTVLIAIPADGAKVWRSELNQASPKAARQLLDTILASPAFLSQAALDRRAGRERQAQEALRHLAGSIRESPDTHSGPHLRRFLWSLFNEHHALNLWHLKNVLDSRHNKLVSEVFTAWMEGHVSEGALRTALRDSGELDRWDGVTICAAGQDRLTEALDAIAGLLNSTPPGRPATHLSRANALLQEAADQLRGPTATGQRNLESLGSDYHKEEPSEMVACSRSVSSNDTSDSAALGRSARPSRSGSSAG